jgi:hypothetical protein
VYKLQRGKWKWTKNTGMRIIGSYIRSWERPGDLPRVIEFLCLFAKKQKFLSRVEDHPGFPNNTYNYLFLP